MNTVNSSARSGRRTEGPQKAPDAVSYIGAVQLPASVIRFRRTGVRRWVRYMIGNASTKKPFWRRIEAVCLSYPAGARCHQCSYGATQARSPSVGRGTAVDRGCSLRPARAETRTGLRLTASLLPLFRLTQSYTGCPSCTGSEVRVCQWLKA